MRMRLSDDGTLDTVIECSNCHEELRYNYDGADSDGQTYDEFVDWALEDAEESHDCFDP